MVRTCRKETCQKKKDTKTLKKKPTSIQNNVIVTFISSRYYSLMYHQWNKKKGLTLSLSFQLKRTPISKTEWLKIFANIWFYWSQICFYSLRKKRKKTINSLVELYIYELWDEVFLYRWGCRFLLSRGVTFLIFFFISLILSTFPQENLQFGRWKWNIVLLMLLLAVFWIEIEQGCQ